MHSVYSDGSWTIPDIAAIADKMGLDFLLFSDHHTLQPKKDGLGKFYGKTLVSIGYENSDASDINHLLCFQLDNTVPGIRAEDYTRDSFEKGGLNIIAHPMERRNKLKEFPPYPWTVWDSPDFQGIEIWNQLSEWMEGLTKWNKFHRFIHPLHSTVSPPPDLLIKWDELAQKRKVFGISGVDAHAFKRRFLFFFTVHIFHYKVMFKSLRNHLLLTEPFPRDDYPLAERMIYDALRQGRLFFSNHRRGNAAGFRFYAESDGKTFQMGDEISSRKVTFFAESPLTAELKLIHNGKPVCWTLSNKLQYDAFNSGVYRIEVRRSGNAWIYSNHIYVL